MKNKSKNNSLINHPGIIDSAGPGTGSSYFMQSNYNIDIYGQAPDKMTYTDQAQKRKECQRLTW
jgi:dynein heavy chain